MKTMKKIVAIAAAVLMLCSILPMAALSVAAAENKDDFASIGKNQTSYTTYTTTGGWKAENSQIKGIDSTYGPMLNGKTSAKGKVTSPTLSNGISQLTFRYANPNKESNGVSVTINIKQNSTTVATSQLVNKSVTQNALYDYSWTLESPVYGDFVIEIVNNCPSNKNSNADRVAIWNITWVSAASGGSTCEHANTVPVAGKDATCTESGLTAGKQCSDCEMMIEKQETINALGHNYVDGICTRCEAEEPEGFVLVTDVSQLKAGAQVIIAGSGTYNVAMSVQNGNYRNWVAITKEDDIIAPVDGVVVFTMETGAVAGTFAFKDSTGYLYAPGGGNYLKTQSSLNDSASWAITITDGAAELVAQITAEQKYLQYNAGSGQERFSCYKGTQKPVAIYMLPANDDDEPVEPPCEHENAKACDTKCPDCEAPLEGVAHKYDNAHDNTCEYGCDVANPAYKAECETDAAYACVAGKCVYCGEDMPATAEHKYDNAHDNTCEYGCDVANPDYKAECKTDATYACVAGKCVYCGEDMPATAEHIYDNAFDTDCNTCGAVRAVVNPSTIVAYDGASVSEDVDGLAFKFTVSATGITTDPAAITTAIYDNAKVVIDGVEYKLLGMGARVSNGKVQSNGLDYIDIPCKYLCDLQEDSASFAVRIINIGEHKNVKLTATPYYTVEIDGVATTLLGDSTTPCSYNDKAEVISE